MNVFCFTGNLGKEAETRFTQAGDPIVSFSVAVKSGFGEREKTIWVRCSMFGNRGERVAPYLLKGQLVGVVGEMTAREWQDKEGLTRTSIEVRVNDLTLLGKRDDSGAQNQSHAPQQQQQRQQNPSPQPAANLANMEDDIPF